MKQLYNGTEADIKRFNHNFVFYDIGSMEYLDNVPDSAADALVNLYPWLQMREQTKEESVFTEESIFVVDTEQNQTEEQSQEIQKDYEDEIDDEKKEEIPEEENGVEGKRKRGRPRKTEGDLII